MTYDPAINYQTGKKKKLNRLLIILAICGVFTGIIIIFTPFKISAIGFLIVGVLRLSKPLFFKDSKERRLSLEVKNSYAATYSKAGMAPPVSLTRDGIKQFYDFMLIIGFVMIFVGFLIPI